MQEGEPSYKLYAEEKKELLESLKRRAIKLHKTLSSLEGVTCTEPEGALYAMPQIRLPKAAIEVILLPLLLGSCSAFNGQELKGHYPLGPGWSRLR